MISEELTKDSCYAWLASQMNNKTICENIKNEAIKWVCLTGEVKKKLPGKGLSQN